MRLCWPDLPGGIPVKSLSLLERLVVNESWDDEYLGEDTACYGPTVSNACIWVDVLGCEIPI